MGEGGRRRLPSTLTFAVAAASLAAAPPVTVFRPGHNLCKTATLSAIREAGGEHYKAGIFASGTCIWERPDLAAGITLATHPRTAGLQLMHQFLSQAAMHPTRVSVPGAESAVLVQTSGRSKDLFALYRGGVVQVNMTAPGGPPVSRLVAVMRLVAPRA
ncbi:MAG TPA: hypothetical protein VGG88_07825 [Gaiellaceae bacterium]|jgi:hypothetical protein